MKNPFKFSPFEISIWLIFVITVAVATPYFYKSDIRSHSNRCIRNLVQIQTSKIMWTINETLKRSAEGEGQTNTFAEIRQTLPAPTLADLYGAEYETIKHKCPSGGQYTIGKLRESPTCSHRNFKSVDDDHVFPDKFALK